MRNKNERVEHQYALKCSRTTLHTVIIEKDRRTQFSEERTVAAQFEHVHLDDLAESASASALGGLVLDHRHLTELHFLDLACKYSTSISVDSD